MVVRKVVSRADWRAALTDSQIAEWWATWKLLENVWAVRKVAHSVDLSADNWAGMMVVWMADLMVAMQAVSSVDEMVDLLGSTTVDLLAANWAG